MSSVPGGASHNRAISAASVDFPLPVGPTMASVEPAGTCRLMSCSTGPAAACRRRSAQSDRQTSDGGIQFRRESRFGAAAARLAIARLPPAPAPFPSRARAAAGSRDRRSSMLGSAVQNVIQPAHRSRAALKNIGHPADRDHRKHQLDQEAVERREGAERNRRSITSRRPFPAGSRTSRRSAP